MAMASRSTVLSLLRRSRQAPRAISFCAQCALLPASTSSSRLVSLRQQVRPRSLLLHFSTSSHAQAVSSVPSPTHRSVDSSSEPRTPPLSSRSSSSEREERAESEDDTSSSSSSSSTSQSFWSALFSPFRRAFAWYLAQLTRRPYTVQMLTSAFLFAIGDITAQHYEAYIDLHKAPDPSHPHPHPHELLHHHELHPEAPPSTPFSFHRLLACSLFGLLVMGPGGHWWYSRLDRWVAPFARPLTMKNVGLKVLLDTAIFNPIFLVVFFSSVSLMEGKSWQEIRYKLWRDFVPSYAVDCSVWPMVQTFNFRFVPVPLQLLVVNLFCYFDDVFLSYVQHNGMPGVFLWIEEAWLAYIGESKRRVGGVGGEQKSNSSVVPVTHLQADTLSANVQPVAVK